MRRRPTALLLSCLWLALLGGCKEQAPERAPSRPTPAASVAPAMLASSDVNARPLNSAVVSLQKTLQQDKLPLPPRKLHAPQLAFGKGVLGQLTRDALVAYDAHDFQQLINEPLDGPRAVLALADGSLLGIGARTMLRWEKGKKRATRLPKPMLLPQAQLYADAQQADLLWIFDGEGGTGAGPATLSSYRLTPDGSSLQLPEQTIELASPRGGVFGITREGVWLYRTSARVERLSPGGLRLPGVTLKEGPLPTWMVPARRLDQSLWLDEAGVASRVLVSPVYKQLSSVPLAGKVLDADVGDEGRLLAIVAVTGHGPSFELLLLDEGLALVGRAPLPGDAPTGSEDWVKVVTENQNVVVAARGAQVAVGGPLRVTIFDARGAQLFSIPSR